ncbi:hypothetical protein PZ897_09920 [Hoeflea sp. YIM 152468]|uniref:hypothetical protein n=1 Tax=Hoeflea sp. YIM 152468 TaxID=3031759 RepID=UPI0023DA085C|nr:hypothetical protein [Hoeflea sp. YIM 152468]MDF1608492.1 hypothetical protein [Hoeflea sp. YIM 152468]
MLSGHVVAQSPEQSEQNQAEGQRQDDTRNQSPPSFSIPIRILEEPEQSESSKQQEQESAKREKQDLAAQKSMAESTKEIVWITKVQIGLAVFGAVALLYSLHLNRMSARAAVDAVKIARANAEAELRAWVGYAHWSMDCFGKTGKVEAYLFRIHWKNYGVTPAKKVVAVAGSPEDPTKFGSDGPLFPFIGDGAVNPPGVVFQTEPLTLTPEDVLATRERPVRLRSAIRYDCVFDGMNVRVSDVTIEIRYIGKAGIEAIRVGAINPDNFAVAPIESNEMT